MQTPPSAGMYEGAVLAQLGAVLIVAALSLAPLSILVARRMFPGRNVVFARWGFSHVALVLIFGIPVALLSQRVWPASPDAPDVTVELVRMAAIMAAIIALVVRFAHKLDPEGWRALGMWRGMHARAIATGGLVYFLSFPGILGLGFVWPWVLRQLGIEYETQALVEAFRSLPPDRTGLVLLLGVVVLPLFEEVLFRAFLQPLLVQNFSEKGGVVLTSFVFAMLHGESAFLPVFGLSLVLGGVMLRTQRLTAVWAVHALHNGLTFVAIAAFTHAREIASGS